VKPPPGFRNETRVSWKARGTRWLNRTGWRGFRCGRRGRRRGTPPPEFVRHSRTLSRRDAHSRVVCEAWSGPLFAYHRMASVRPPREPAAYDDDASMQAPDVTFTACGGRPVVCSAARMLGSAPMTAAERQRRARQAGAAAEQDARRAAASLARKQRRQVQRRQVQRTDDQHCRGDVETLRQRRRAQGIQRLVLDGLVLPDHAPASGFAVVQVAGLALQQLHSV